MKHLNDIAGSVSSKMDFHAVFGAWNHLLINANANVVIGFYKRMFTALSATETVF